MRYSHSRSSREKRREIMIRSISNDAFKVYEYTLTQAYQWDFGEAEVQKALEACSNATKEGWGKFEVWKDRILLVNHTRVVIGYKSTTDNHKVPSEEIRGLVYESGDGFPVLYQKYLKWKGLRRGTISVSVGFMLGLFFAVINTPLAKPHPTGMPLFVDLLVFLGLLTFATLTGFIFWSLFGRAPRKREIATSTEDASIAFAS